MIVSSGEMFMRLLEPLCWGYLICFAILWFSTIRRTNKVQWEDAMEHFSKTGVLPRFSYSRKEWAAYVREKGGFVVRHRMKLSLIAIACTLFLALRKEGFL